MLVTTGAVLLANSARKLGCRFLQQGLSPEEATLQGWKHTTI